MNRFDKAAASWDTKASSLAIAKACVQNIEKNTENLTNKYNQITSSIGYFIYGGIIVHIISLIIFIYDPLTISLYNFSLILNRMIESNFIR